MKIDKSRLQKICESNDISYLGLFGSYAVELQNKDSDIDLLVDFEVTKSLLEKGKATVELQEFFKKEIDLTSRKNLKQTLKPFVDKQLITLYEAK